MDGAEISNQRRVVGAGFSNVSHFKKLCNKDLLGVINFYFIWGVLIGVYQLISSVQEVYVGNE